MPNEPQTISAAAFSIAPVQVKPTQDILLVDEQRSASINYIIGTLVKGKAEVLEIPGVLSRGAILESGKPGDAAYQPYVAPIEGRALVPAIPAVPDSVISVESGTITMTDDEWKGWLTQDDKDYRSKVVAKRLALTIL